MNSILKSFSAIALSLSAAAAFATPTYLTTYNNTDEESNAFVAGVPSPYATPAHSKKDVYWNLVKIACFGHSTPDKKCAAVIKMATNTGNPIELGTVTMNLISGEITPSSISGNGYTLTVNGPGVATISKN